MQPHLSPSQIYLNKSNTMPGNRASKITAPPTLADSPPGVPDGAGDVGTDATSTDTTAAATSTVNAVTGPTIDLTAHDAAMVKVFERLGALKGAASFFVLDQGINSLAAILDLDDDAIESLYKLCRKPKSGHHVALQV